ncbi:MAG: hypothetical protein ACTSPG_09675 [Candidatus Hodarchaeales archaeon]
MAGSLPFVDFVPLLVIILTVAIAFFALFAYLKIDKRKQDLIIGAAFALLTLALVLGLFQQFLTDNNLGGLDQYLQLFAYIIFLVAIEPMKVINHLKAKE